MNREGRGATQPIPLTEATLPETFTGNRALALEEGLLFEIGRPDVSGVDLPEPPAHTSRLGRHARKNAPHLPGLSEPEAMRH